jgi:surface polysaccharide O-acyltransferase-like enzyme
VLLYHFIFQTPLWVPSVYFKPEVFRVQRSSGNAALLCCVSTILKLTGAWKLYKRITEQEDAQYQYQYIIKACCFQCILISQMSPVHVLLKPYPKFILMASSCLRLGLPSVSYVTGNLYAFLDSLTLATYSYLYHTCLCLTRIKFLLLLTCEVPLCNITGKEFLALPTTPQAAGTWFETAKFAGRKNKNSIALYSYVTIT